MIAEANLSSHHNLLLQKSQVGQSQATIRTPDAALGGASGAMWSNSLFAPHCRLDSILPGLGPLPTRSGSPLTTQPPEPIKAQATVLQKYRQNTYLDTLAGIYPWICMGFSCRHVHSNNSPPPLHPSWPPTPPCRCASCLPFASLLPPCLPTAKKLRQISPCLVLFERFTASIHPLFASSRPDTSILGDDYTKAYRPRPFTTRPSLNLVISNYFFLIGLCSVPDRSLIADCSSGFWYLAGKAYTITSQLIPL